MYDFVVVGTDSAGTVLSNRLNEISSVQILALEAGERQVPPAIENPSLWPTLLGSSIDWTYTSIAQSEIDGCITNEPRGKFLGRTSNLLGGNYFRDHTADYDHRAYSGCPGWSYQEVVPLEHQEDDTNLTVGKNGPLWVTNAKQHHSNPTPAIFINACQELGYPSTNDFNATHFGMCWHRLSIKDGKHQSTEVVSLLPALTRLTLRVNAQASLILFDNHCCIGVEYMAHGQSKTPYAEREVIVCADTIESSKLLLLSGSGQASRLRGLGIRVIAELPSVGKNLHNHVQVAVIQEASQPVPVPQQNFWECTLLCQSHPGWIGSDLQITFVHVPISGSVVKVHPNLISLLPTGVRLLSRGWLHVVNPNYLVVRSDLERLVREVKIAREIYYRTGAFASWIGNEVLPGPDGQNDHLLRDFVRKTADSSYHQVGSCKIGLDNMVVVDPSLHVYGVEALHVADASEMPMAPFGDCHTAILIIAEKAADLIKRDTDCKIVRDGRRTRLIARMHRSHALFVLEATMKRLEGKKIGILIESDFFEREIFYYQYRFPEEGAELHFLSRLWGQPSLTFLGHEYKAPLDCYESFEGMDDVTLRSFSAIIVPSGMVADRLRYTEDIHILPPATTFLQRAFAMREVLKGIICHGMWLVAPTPELVRGRKVVAHNNLLGDVRNMGAIYTDEDVVIDNDLVTGRAGPHCHQFAHTIIDLLAAQTLAPEGKCTCDNHVNA